MARILLLAVVACVVSQAQCGVLVRDLAADVAVALEANSALFVDTSLLSGEIASFSEVAGSEVPDLILQMDELLLAFGIAPEELDVIHQQSTAIVLSVAVNSAARTADLAALLDLLAVIEQNLASDLPQLAEDLVALQSQVTNVLTELSANAVDLTNRVFLLNLQLNALIRDLPQEEKDQVLVVFDQIFAVLIPGANGIQVAKAQFSTSADALTVALEVVIAQVKSARHPMASKL